MTPAPIIDDTQARIDRIEQRIRSLHVSDGVIGWDGYDDLPVTAFHVEFCMPDIERYTGIGCPRIHLQLYIAVMRGHRLDEAQMIMLFPLSMSGAAQHWLHHWTLRGVRHGLIWDKSLSDNILLIL